MRVLPRLGQRREVGQPERPCGKIFAQIGAGADVCTWEAANTWGKLPQTVTVHKGEAIFPRVDAQKALEELEAIQEAQKKAALPAMEFEPMAEEKVDFDTFCKSDFRAVKVKACEAVKKSEKLLRFTLDDGTGTDRQILSGIHKWYKPEELVGKTLVAIVNLPPRKMMGLESCGMLLSAVHTEKGLLYPAQARDRSAKGADECDPIFFPEKENGRRPSKRKAFRLAVSILNGLYASGMEVPARGVAALGVAIRFGVLLLSAVAQPLAALLPYGCGTPLRVPLCPSCRGAD